MTPEDYVSVDIEGAESSPAVESSLIREIGACSVWNTNKRFFVRFFNPGYPLDQLVSPETGMRHFEEWLESFKKPIFVCFNAWDWLHVNYYFWKYLGRCPFGTPGRVIDIKVYYMGKMGKPYKETNKRDIVKFFPPIQKHTHNGLDDAVEQAQIFRQMLELDLAKADTRGPESP